MLKPQKHKAQIINDIYTTAKNSSFACKRPLACVFSILRAPFVNYFDNRISIHKPLIAKSGSMLIRVGVHLTSSFNHFAGAGLVPARNQFVRIDKSNTLAIQTKPH